MPMKPIEIPDTPTHPRVTSYGKTGGYLTPTSVHKIGGLCGIGRTYRRGYLDHAFTLHCTILPQSRATSRIAGPGGSIKCIFV